MERDPGLPNLLSERELDVLWLYGGLGYAAKQAAFELGISEETTKSYLKRIREKLRARQGPASRCGTKHGLFLIALDECRHRPECQMLRDELLRAMLTDGAPELVQA